MSLLDGVIVIGGVAAALQGYRLGFLARAASWLGLFVAVVITARALPDVGQLFDGADPVRALLAFAGVLMLAGLVGQLAGLLAASRLRPVAPAAGTARADRLAGAAAGVVGVLATVWLLGPTMANIPEWPAAQARHSLIVRAVVNTLPAAPPTFERLYALVEPSATINRAPGPIQATPDLGPPPDAPDLEEAVLERASAAAVRIRSGGCRYNLQGSGVVVRHGDASRAYVLTNAHVIAGATSIEATNGLGDDLGPLTPVLFDPDRDLAVLAPAGPPAGAAVEGLVVGDGRVGQVGTVLGYRRDAGLQVRGALLAEAEEITAGSIYDDFDQHEREVWYLAADLGGGDSGAPVVSTDGEVVGLVFATAPDVAGVGYALRPDALFPVLDAAEAHLAAGGGAVSTEHCRA
ncbi:MAG: MarP family serine protease [Actinomycetota bacterium]|nr:MarP family serine protease [Actinomycetota bacterium]